MSGSATLLAVITLIAGAFIATADGYRLYVIVMVGLTAIAGIGLNVLVGMTGQISLGHVVSGGEQQLLAIARVLMAKPRVMLLDDPSIGLAPKMLEEVYALLAELREEGITILLVDQKAALALSIADRAYVLQSGVIARSGNAAGIARDPELEHAYVGRHGLHA